MTRVKRILSKGKKGIQDLGLLKALRTEITYELFNNRFQGRDSGSLRNFVLEWNAPNSQDVVLRNKFESGGEIAISAMLGGQVTVTDTDIVFPREVLMKVCVKKPGLSSFLQFDCGVSPKNGGGTDFDIHNAFYLQSKNCFGNSVYKGPLFSTLDPDLQDALKQYLVSKGIEDSLTKFLVMHLHRKEQDQYVNWLKKLETAVAMRVTDSPESQGPLSEFSK